MSANQLARRELSAETADRFVRQQRRKARVANGKTPGGKHKKVKPVPIPGSIAEIKRTHPDHPAFRKGTEGRPRKKNTTTEDTSELGLREVTRREKQRRQNGRRARARKAESLVAATYQGLVSQEVDIEIDPDAGLEATLVQEGFIELDDWDDEELARGYRRNRSGRFGAPPKFIPREVQQEAFRRLIRRGERKLKSAFVKGCEGLVDLAQNADSERVRLSAIQELLERLVGKVPETVRVGAEAPWTDMLVDAVELPDPGLPMDLEMDDDGVARMFHKEAAEESGGAGDAPDVRRLALAAGQEAGPTSDEAPSSPDDIS